MPFRRVLIAGNWKMNMTRAAAADLVAALRAADVAGPELLVCPPAILIPAVVEAAKGSALGVGGQDCHANASGAHTGDIAAEMLADAGAGWTIVGHSERRTDHAETDAVVNAKASAARRAGLKAVICVGETLAERQAGQTLAILTRQIAASVPDGATAANTVVAYEPVWAIGSGLTPTNAEIAAAHAHLRAELRKRTGEADGVRLLYGGSVKPSNAAEILAIPDVDGALVGGASLKAADFLGIATAAPVRT